MLRVQRASASSLSPRLNVSSTQNADTRNRRIARTAAPAGAQSDTPNWWPQRARPMQKSASAPTADLRRRRRVARRPQAALRLHAPHAAARQLSHFSRDPAGRSIAGVASGSDGVGNSIQVTG